jgi:hypothetical protein
MTNDRYLVDTGATLSIVPCSQNSSPSGPLHKGAEEQSIPSWGFIQKTVQFQASFLQQPFGKLLWLVPFWALTFCENFKSLFLQKSTKYSLLVLQQPCPPPFCLQRPRPPTQYFQWPRPPRLFYLARHRSQLRFQFNCPLPRLLHSLLPYPHL